MSNTIQDIGATLGLDMSSAARGASGESGDTFMKMLAMQMAGEESGPENIGVPASALSQIANSGGSSLESLVGEIVTQLQGVNAQQASSAAATAYGAASSAYDAAPAPAGNYPWRPPYKVENGMEYYDYDVTSFMDPTESPNSNSDFEGG